MQERGRFHDDFCERDLRPCRGTPTCHGSDAINDFGCPPGVGYDTISDILNNNLALKLLILVAVFKALALVISLGSGTSGGLLAPMFMSSAALGGSFAIVVNLIVPGAHLSPGAYALVAMAAVSSLGGDHANRLLKHWQATLVFECQPWFYPRLVAYRYFWLSEGRVAHRG